MKESTLKFIKSNKILFQIYNLQKKNESAKKYPNKTKTHSNQGGWFPCRSTTAP